MLREHYKRKYKPELRAAVTSPDGIPRVVVRIAREVECVVVRFGRLYHKIVEREREAGCGCL